MTLQEGSTEGFGILTFIVGFQQFNTIQDGVAVIEVNLRIFLIQLQSSVVV